MNGCFKHSRLTLSPDLTIHCTATRLLRRFSSSLSRYILSISGSVRQKLYLLNTISLCDVLFKDRTDAAEKLAACSQLVQY